MAGIVGRLMHELAITQSIVAAVTEHAGGRAVTRVVLEVGELAGVSIDAILFCFDLAAAGTPLEGAALDIKMVAAEALCRSCGSRFSQRALVMPCACGSHDVERLSGEELNIKQYELAVADLETAAR